MKRWSVIAGLAAISLAAVGIIAACGGSDGKDGAAGAAGAGGTNGGNGGNGTPGTAGNPGTTGAQGDAGPTIVISSTAKHGLDISPVKLKLDGLTGDQVEKVGKGSYIVNALGGCNDCHASTATPSVFLAGGRAFGTVYARNLTPDPATGMKLTEDQFVTALRTGADFSVLDGGAPTALNVMPWTTYRWMSADDLKSIYAYLKAIPAATSAVTPDVKGAAAPTPFPSTFTDGQTAHPIPPELDATDASVPDPGNVLRGYALVPIDTPALGLTDATQAAQFGRGAYLVTAAAGCSSCHTNPAKAGGKINFAKYLTGGQIENVPAAQRAALKETRGLSANLIGASGFFNGGNVDFPVFLTTITQGIKADDNPAPPLGYNMPWQRYKLMTLEDLGAVYTYMAVLSKKVAPTDKVIQENAVYCAADGDCTAIPGTCNVATNECIATATCASNNDCAACQTCDTGVTDKCLPPATGAACLTSGVP